MTKHFCDRCGDEMSRVNEIKIKIPQGMEATAIFYDVCDRCRKEINKFIKRGKDN